MFGGHTLDIVLLTIIAVPVVDDTLYNVVAQQSLSLLLARHDVLLKFLGLILPVRVE
jgi:hypothetical protein